MAAESEEFNEEAAEEAQMLENAAEVEDIEASYVNSARPSTEANVAIQLLVGLVGTLVVCLGVIPLDDRGGTLEYIHDVFNERGPVQYGELYMAFMIGTMVYLKGRLLKRQTKSIADSPVTHTVDLSNDQHLAQIRSELRNVPSFTWSIVLVRMDRILALWLGTKDVGRVSTWLSTESSRDTSLADSSYALGRVLIWAIPILGFIGTVLGLGAAVSGFSAFLGGAADLGAIKEAIGGVTSGLGTAFDTTLLALVLSVVLMFPMSTTQRKEETFFVTVDNYLDDMLVSRFPSGGQAPIVIENLEDSIEAAFRRYIPDPDRYDEVFSRAIDRAAQVVEEKFQGLAQGYEATLSDASVRMSQSITSAGTTVETGIKSAVADLQSQDQKLLAARKAIVQEESERLRATLQEVQEAAVNASNEARRSADGLAAATQGSMDKALAASDAIASRMEEISRLASSIEELLRVDQAVQQGLQTLASTDDFKNTLISIRQHLASTDDFCARLSKPRVVTLEEYSA